MQRFIWLIKKYFAKFIKLNGTTKILSILEVLLVVAMTIIIVITTVIVLVCLYYSKLCLALNDNLSNCWNYPWPNRNLFVIMEKNLSCEQSPKFSDNAVVT